MIYLFLGEDVSAKDARLIKIKKEIFRSAQDTHFDQEILYADKLEPAQLKKALIALPALAPKRLIIIRQIQKLTQHHKSLIREFLQSRADHAVLLLDSDEADVKDAFLEEMAKVAHVEFFDKGPKVNLFAMTDAMTAKKSAEALKILNELVTDGVHPLQIMGGLVWFWGKCRLRLPIENYKKGLFELQEADLNIKRSRLEPEHALELVVVKLCSLIAY